MKKILIVGGFAGLGLLSLGLSFRSAEPPPAATSPAASADCRVGGRFDHAVAAVIGSGQGTLVQGWVVAPAGATLQLESGFTLPILTSEERRDVAAAFPDCGLAQRSGFTIRLPGETTRGKAWIVVNDPATGERKLDELVLPEVSLRLELDALHDVEPNGVNVLSGWALSVERTPVTVSVIAEGRVVARTTTGHPRTDVAATLRNESTASRSGFDVRIPFASLPRGDYRLELLAESADGQRLRRPGPMVKNAYPYAVALTLWDKRKNPSSLRVAIWAAHERGIKSVELTTSASAKTIPLQRRRSGVSFTGPSKEIVREMVPPIRRGDIWSRDIPNTLGEGVHRLGARVVTRDGHELWVPAQLVVNESPPKRTRNAACARAPLLVFYPTGPGTSAGLGPQHEVMNLKSLVDGPCVKVGMRIRVEYLRTTLGSGRDYVFDPYFNSQKTRVNGRAMTTAGLVESLELARRHGMPILISLDGGVWADSVFEAPDWDVVDMLEQDEQLVQWNQFNKSEPDDALANLNGAVRSPQLARMMSLNVFNDRFRGYKRRNLQAAVAFIRRFQERHPGVDVWVNFDSDNYINPWFKDQQWYDYNPNTVAQFRQWLTGAGVYANELRGLSRKPTLSLAEINAMAGARWQSIDDIDPPRGPMDPSSRWYHTWIEFKRHLVAQHYSDLSRWACEAGMPPERIYTAVGISDSTVAVEQDDPLRSWNDQSGVSVRGGKPSCGHLGVVVYGPASRGKVLDSRAKSPLRAAEDIDPMFGVVEFHPANLDLPQRLPTREEAKETMQALIAASRFISPMWGGVASGQFLAPRNFRAYEAMEGTEFEYALVEQLRALNAQVDALHPRDAGTANGRRVASASRRE